ncbi:MAG TPA: hypothetical protein VLJ62_29405, partial [Burkholderiaceae bacterium]|nr:hypothetical protein [Burkholderiaceae bacterium]
MDFVMRHRFPKGNGILAHFQNNDLPRGHLTHAASDGNPTRRLGMNRKLLPALLLSAGVLSPLAVQANDRGHGHHGRDRDRAADLADCCTPGDKDFPKVGGNLGN